MNGGLFGQDSFVGIVKAARSDLFEIKCGYM